MINWKTAERSGCSTSSTTSTVKRSASRSTSHCRQNGSSEASSRSSNGAASRAFYAVTMDRNTCLRWCSNGLKAKVSRSNTSNLESRSRMLMSNVLTVPSATNGWLSTSSNLWVRSRTTQQDGSGTTITSAQTWPWAASRRNSGWPWPHKSTYQIPAKWGITGGRRHDQRKG